MSSASESVASGWAKVMIPLLVTVCMALGTALWNQSSTVTSLESTVSQHVSIIDDFKREDVYVRAELSELRENLGSVKADLRIMTGTQDKVLDVVDRLSTTLGRLEIAMGKLETKLEYRNKEPR